MKITKWGMILVFKNLGTFFATWTFADVKSDMGTFIWAFLIYALMNIPTDLLISNHMTIRKEAKTNDGKP